MENQFNIGDRVVVKNASDVDEYVGVRVGMPGVVVGFEQAGFVVKFDCPEAITQGMHSRSDGYYMIGCQLRHEAFGEWDGVFRVGDKGTNGYGTAYTVTSVNGTYVHSGVSQPIEAAVGYPALVIQRYSATGQFDSEPGRCDLLPPTERGPVEADGDDEHVPPDECGKWDAAFPDVAKAASGYSTEAIEQQANAWRRITRVLDDVSPGWLDFDASGAECAERAIRGLKAENESLIAANPSGGRWIGGSEVELLRERNARLVSQVGELESRIADDGDSIDDSVERVIDDLTGSKAMSLGAYASLYAAING